MKLIIVEIPEEQIGLDLMTAFKYMVQTEEGGSWFGSSDKKECEQYIDDYNGTV